MCLFHFYLLQGHQTSDSGYTLVQSGLILKSLPQLYAQRLLFQIKSHSEVLVNISFEGHYSTHMGFPCESAGKKSTHNVGDLGLIPSWEYPLEKGKAPHSSVLAWRIPWAV